MKELETDICVIGSGVAGVIVAKECVDAGREVLMLEAGDRVNGNNLLIRLLEKVIRDYRIPRMRLLHRGSRYQKSDYRNVGNKKYGLRGRAVCAVGGSILGWIGSSYRLKPEDFRLGSASGTGIDWPIGYDELEPYYSLSEKTLRVAGDHTDKGHPPRSTSFPFPAKLFHERDKPFLDLLSANGWSPMHHNIALTPHGSAFTLDSMISRLERKSNFRLFPNCVATRILCSSREKAAGVACLSTIRDEFITINAETVVLCAGGIETPNLLRVSANKWRENGLGNHSNHLGRHLISHSGIGLGGWIQGPRLINGPIGTTAITRFFDSEKEQTKGKFILLWVPAPAGLLFLNVTMEQFPNVKSTISHGLSRTRFGTPQPIMNLYYSENLKQREIFVEELLHSLASRIRLKISHRRHYVNAHPMCTSRMSSNPQDGVIDSNLRLHTMKNIYVCGSASFTSGGAANPTLTIAALAHRLGHHLTNNHKHDVGHT